MRPASVSVTLALFRSNRRIRYRFSRELIDLLNPDWLRPSRSAARVKFNSSDNVMMAIRRRTSIVLCIWNPFQRPVSNAFFLRKTADANESETFHRKRVAVHKH
jgi:hypothetical protein